MRLNTKYKILNTKYLFYIIIALWIGFFAFWYFSKSAGAVPWSSIHTDWGQRKQLTLVNNSGSTISANVPYQINVDTKTLFLASRNNIKPTCDDLRVVYQPNNTTNTELARSYALAQGATSCTDSSSTIITFPLQASITNSSTDANYYIYYANPGAPAYTASTALSSYNINGKTATFVAPFNGTTTALAAGSGTPTTATGAIRYSGGKSALSFDGFDDYMTTANAGGLVAGSAYTIEAWVKLPDPTVSSSYFFDSGTIRRTLIFNSGGNGNLIFATAGGGAEQINSGALSWTANQWYHLAVTFNPTANYKAIYRDGVLVASGSNGITDGTPASFYIGAKTDSAYFSKIVIDEFRISNVVRYSSNFTPPTSPFIRDANTKLLYHLDESGDDPRNTGKAIDDSGNANHGTLTNSPQYVSGLIGVDASTSDTGKMSTQPYAGHQGVFIEEGTTNKITNPSFENSTSYATGWTAAGSNLTASQNTTAPYYKFGNSSAKIVAAADGNLVTTIDPNSTASHTLSAYVYNGTSGAVGGTVDGTVSKLVWEGNAVTTTYTNMGGGWWRLTYSAATTDQTNSYGIQVLAGKTVYVDGFQLEQKAMATSYTDGNLGNSYGWDSDCSGSSADGNGTANNSCSIRTVATLKYSTTSNINTTAGAVSFWIYKNWANRCSGFPGDTRELIWLGSDNSKMETSCSSTIKFYWGDQTQVTLTGLTDNVWHHIVGVWYSDKTSKVCIDNSCSSTATGDNFPTLTTDINFSGGYNVVRTPIATTSDFRIYSGSLADADIADIYRTGLASHSEGASLEKNTPVLNWKFEEAQGTTAQDSSSNNLDGTISAATYNTDTPYKASQFSLAFNGTSAKVSKSYWFDSKLDPGTDSFAVSGWFKHSSTISGTDTLISRADAVNGVGYKIYMNSSGYICFGTDGTAGSFPADSACTTTSYADSKWYFVEGVKDGVNNNLTLYINGVQVATDTSLADALSLSGSSPTLYVGIDADGTSNPWDGFIDDIKVYGQIRTSAQVKTDFDSNGALRGVGTSIGGGNTEALTEGLVGYWKMDETSGNATDASGNGRTGTVNSGTRTSGKFGNGINLNGGAGVDISIPDF